MKAMAAPPTWARRSMSSSPFSAPGRWPSMATWATAPDGMPDGVMRASYQRVARPVSPRGGALPCAHFASLTCGCNTALCRRWRCRIPTASPSATCWTSSTVASPDHSVPGTRQCFPSLRSAGLPPRRQHHPGISLRHERAQYPADKGFDSSPADLSESGPRMTLVDGAPLLENAHHHEISMSQRDRRQQAPARLLPRPREGPGAAGRR